MSSPVKSKCSTRAVRSPISLGKEPASPLDWRTISFTFDPMVLQGEGASAPEFVSDIVPRDGDAAAAAAAFLGAAAIFLTVAWSRRVFAGSWETAAATESPEGGKVGGEKGRRRSRKTLPRARLDDGWLGRVEDRLPTRELDGGMAVRAWRAVTQVCVVERASEAIKWRNGHGPAI